MGRYLPEYRTAVCVFPTLLGALASAVILPVDRVRMVSCWPMTNAIHGFHRSALYAGFLFWMEAIRALTGSPFFLCFLEQHSHETIPILGLPDSRFTGRVCMTTLLPCLHSSFTIATCSTRHRLRLAVDRLYTHALRRLMTMRSPLGVALTCPSQGLELLVQSASQRTNMNVQLSKFVAMWVTRPHNSNLR